jgi:hypothetical protein
LSEDIEKIRQRVKSKIHDSEKHLKDSPLLDGVILRSLEAGAANLSDDGLDRQTIEQLRELDREFVVRPREGKDVQEPSTYTDKLYSETRLAELAPRVEDLRAEVFPDWPEPPFATERAAWDWVMDVGRLELAREEERLRETYAEFHKDMEEIQRLAYKHGVEIAIETVSIPCRESDGQVRGMPVTSGTNLHKIAYETELMARYTNFLQVDLIAYVLSGSIPKILRTLLTTTEHYHAVSAGQEMTVNMSANIKVNTTTLDRDELRNIYNSWRGPVVGKNKKGELNPVHLRILELVDAKGGPPEKHGAKKQFWEGIFKALQGEQSQGGKRYKNAASVRRTYDRLVERK